MYLGLPLGDKITSKGIWKMYRRNEKSFSMAVVFEASFFALQLIPRGACYCPTTHAR